MSLTFAIRIAVTGRTEPRPEESSSPRSGQDSRASTEGLRQLVLHWHFGDVWKMGLIFHTELGLFHWNIVWNIVWE